MGCASAKRLPREPDDYVDRFDAPASTKFANSTSCGGDNIAAASPSACSAHDDAVCEVVASDGLPGEQSWAQSSRHPTRKATSDALPGRSAEGTADTWSVKKRNRRGDWRQARKPYLSDLPEVDEDIPYRISLVVLGMAANQVVQSACQSAAARSLAAKSLPEKEEARGAEGDLLAELFSAATKATAVEERAVDEHWLLDAGEDRCLCKVSGGPSASVRLAKLVFTRVMPGADLPICASQSEALSTIMVITLVVAGSVLGEDPAAAVHDQLRALKELIELLRTRFPTRLRPLRAVLLCRLGEAGSPPEVCQAHAREWQGIVSEFEEENGRLWKFGPVDPSDREDVHATFGQIAAAGVVSPTRACAGGPDGPEAMRLPGELMAPSLPDAEASQSLQESGKPWKCGPVVPSDKEEVQAVAGQMAAARVSAPIPACAGGPDGPEAVGLPRELVASSLAVSEDSQSRQAARLPDELPATRCLSVPEASQTVAASLPVPEATRLPGERRTTPCHSASEASQWLTPSLSVSEASQTQQKVSQAARPPSEQSTMPSLSVSEASHMQQIISGRCSVSKASQTQQMVSQGARAPGEQTTTSSLPVSEATRLPGVRRTTPCHSVPEASQILTSLSVSEASQWLTPSLSVSEASQTQQKLSQAAQPPSEQSTMPSLSVSEASHMQRIISGRCSVPKASQTQQRVSQAARPPGEQSTTPSHSVPAASQISTSLSVSEASQWLTPSLSVSEVSQTQQKVSQAARPPSEQSTMPSLSVSEASQMQRIISGRCSVSEASQTQQMVSQAARPPGEQSTAPSHSMSEAFQTKQIVFQDLLPVVTNISSSLSSSNASTPMTAAEPALSSEGDKALLEEPADDAAHLSSLIDDASATINKLSAARERDELNSDNPSSLVRTITID